MWQRLKIVFSGHEVPGEGEHKIMGYIRSMKMQPDYNPMTKHCMCGQDADLIMLALATHEPHFSLLREHIDFQSFARVRSSEALVWVCGCVCGRLWFLRAADRVLRDATRQRPRRRPRKR